MVYLIQARVMWTTADGYHTSKGIPTFFLDSNIQGIVDAPHAERIVKDMLELTDQFHAHVSAFPMQSDVEIIKSLYAGSDLTVPASAPSTAGGNNPCKA